MTGSGSLQIRAAGQFRPNTDVPGGDALARQRSFVQLFSYSARSSDQQSAAPRFALMRASNSPKATSWG